jgi:hypothetical protein
MCYSTVQYIEVLYENPCVVVVIDIDIDIVIVIRSFVRSPDGSYGNRET